MRLSNGVSKNIQMHIFLCNFGSNKECNVTKQKVKMQSCKIIFILDMESNISKHVKVLKARLLESDTYSQDQILPSGIRYYAHECHNPTMLSHKDWLSFLIYPSTTSFG